MHSAIKLGRIAAVRVSVDWSLALMVVLIALHLATGVFPAWHPDWTPPIAWLAAFGAAVLFFASVLVHELTQAGPIVSLLVAMLCFVLASAESSAGSTILVSVGWMNIALCAINLLPGYPLDGGRALRALVWAFSGHRHWATLIACRMGQAFGWAGILFGAALCFGVSVPVLGRETSAAPWLMLTGWFLNRAAFASYRSMLIVDWYRGLAALEVLADVAVSNLMREVPTRMHPKDALRDVQARFAAVIEQPLLPIEADGIFLGWVRREDLAGCDFRQVGGPRLAELMIPVNYLPTVRPEQTVAEAVALMNQSCLDYVAVVRQRRLLGMVSREDVITWICRGG